MGLPVERREPHADSVQLPFFNVKYPLAQVLRS